MEAALIVSVVQCVSVASGSVRLIVRLEKRS